jgi:hypothetical protein
MRGMLLPSVAVAVLSCSAAAHADAKSYCEAYARDAATARLTGSAIITGVRTPVSPEQWAAANAQVLADCLREYGASPTTDAPTRRVVASTTAVAATAGDPKPGTPAWNDYCARKYVSFDRATGTYRSLSGKQRPCVVSKN